MIWTGTPNDLGRTGGRNPDWRDFATAEERECCPTCGIARYWLDRAHPNNKLIIDRCADPFHASPPNSENP